MNKEKRWRVCANYSFFRHPIRWIAERKTRKIMTDLVEWDWEKNGGKEEFEKKLMEKLLSGTIWTKR